jgi:hypothetical protein
MRILPKRKISPIDSRGSYSRMNCHHSREDRELIIDCHSCSGGQGLHDELCFRSVLRVLSSGARVDSLILSGNWEVSYGGDCVRALCSLASVVRFCQELAKTPTMFQDCKGCALSPERFFGQLVNRLPIVPNSEQLSSIQVQSAKHQRACKECIDRSRSKLLQIGFAIEELGKYVARSAYMVVEAGDGN